MANDGVVFLLVLLQEILGAGEGHLVDVALHLIGGHADAVVADGERFGFAIHTDPDGPVIPFTAIAGHRRHAALADGVDAIAHQLPQKHLMAGINGLLDDRENVFGVDLNLTLFLQHRHSFAVKNQTLETGFTRAQRLFQGVPRTFVPTSLGPDQGVFCRSGRSSATMAPSTGHTCRQIPQSMQVSKLIQ